MLSVVATCMYDADTLKLSGSIDQSVNGSVIWMYFRFTNSFVITDFDEVLSFCHRIIK